MRILSAVVLMLVSAVATAAPFLVSDPVPASQGAYTISHCAYTRSGVTTNHAVEAVTGGVRCRVDLASDPRTGTVSVAFRDNALATDGPAASFTFGAIPQPGNVRVVPN